MKFITICLLAFLVIAADADRDTKKKKKRQRQRARAQRLFMSMQNIAFPVDDWLKVGNGCCRINGDGALFANEENAVCDMGGEDDITPMQTLKLEKRSECRKACEAISCCAAYEWRPRASQYNCDLFNTSVYPDSCSDDSLLCDGASCWKKNIVINDMLPLTQYTSHSPNGCCRGNVSVITSLPLLDPNKKKKHENACTSACDLVPGCNSVESVFSDSFTARCELFSGKATHTDTGPATCTQANCMVKQCPGNLKALVDAVPLAGSSGQDKELTTEELESEGSSSSSSSDDNNDNTTILTVVVLLVGMVVAVMGYMYISRRPHQIQLSRSAIDPEQAPAQFNLDGAESLDQSSTVDEPQPEAI